MCLTTLDSNHMIIYLVYFNIQTPVTDEEMVFVREESMELYPSKLASAAAKVFNCIFVYLDVVFFLHFTSTTVGEHDLTFLEVLK